MSDSDPVLSLEIDDRLSPGAQAATDALSKLADAADKVDATVTRVGVSASALVNRLDPTARSANAVATATNNLTTQGATLAAGLAAGTITQAEYSASMETLQTKVRAASEAHNAASGSIDHVGGSTRATTMLIRDMTRSYAELAAGISPLEIAAKSMGNLEHATESFGAVAREAFSFLTSGPGIALAAVAVFGAIGYAAESAESRILAMQTALTAVNANPIATAAIGNVAARAVAQTGAVSLADATGASESFLNQPSIIQTTANIQSLILEANDLAAVTGQTVPAAAAKMAAAFDAPGKMAQELADVHMKGFNDSLARSIQLQADAGDKAGAYAKLLDIVHAASDGAAEASKTGLEKALDDLHGAFTRTGDDGKSFGDVLGKAVTEVAAGAITVVANLVKEIRGGYDAIHSLTPPSWLPPWVLSAGGSLLPGVGPLINLGTGLASVTPSGTPAAQGAAPAYDVSQMSTIVQGFVSAGMSLDDAVAYAANAMRESGGNYQSVNMADAPGGSHGAFQWNGTRLADFQSQNGGLLPEQTSLQTQLAFVMSENANLKADVYNQVQANPDLGSKAAIVTSGYEVPADKVGQGQISANIATDFMRRFNAPAAQGGAAIEVGGAVAVDDPSAQILSAVASAKGPAYDYATAAANAKNLQTALDSINSGKGADALAKLAAAGVPADQAVQQLNDALNKNQVAMANALSPAAKLLQALSYQTAGLDEVTAAWASGSVAAADATAHVQAEAEARGIAGAGTAQYADAVARLTAAHIAEKTAQDDSTLAMQSFKASLDTQYLQAEIATLGQSAQARNEYLAVLKATQQIQLQEPHASADRILAAQNEAAATANLTFQLQQQQQAFAEIGNLATQAFDEVGNAIVQAYTSGNGASIQWGNVTRSVIASVIQEFAKLAILNPILNSITGGNAVTLGSVFSAVAGSGSSGSAAGGTSAISLLGTGSSLVSGGSSIAQLLGYQGIGSYLGDSLGLTGSGGLISGALSTQIIPAVYTPLFAAGSSEAASGGLGAIGGSALGGATAGSLIGGVGAGFALGSLSGSLLQGSLNKVGPAPLIGAGTGALAGAGIGVLAGGPYGALIGGILGGILGGTGGGLIGPHAASTYSGTQVLLQNGQLTTGSSNYQGEGSNLTSTQSDVDTVNAFLSQYGLNISTVGNLKTIGTYGSGQVDPTTYGSVADAFPNFGFGASDAGLNTAVAGKTYPDLTTFETAVTGYETLVNSTIPALTAQTTVTGSLNDALAAITATFGPAITAAQSYGVATDALTAAQATAIQTANTNAWATVVTTNTGLEARYQTAQATVTGLPGDSESAALFAFDSQEQAQRDALSKQLTDLYGTAFNTTESYATEMALLETTLGEERLAIAQQYADKLAATATGTVQSLTAYAQKLATGSESPLSPTAQYALASSQFGADATGAAAGDYTDLSNFPTLADAFLAASKTVNGSGAQYAADFGTVTTALQNAATLTPDTLTASIYVSEQRTATQVLNDSLTALLAAVQQLIQQQTVSNIMPSRVSS